MSETGIRCLFIVTSYNSLWSFWCRVVLEVSKLWIIIYTHTWKEKKYYCWQPPLDLETYELLFQTFEAHWNSLWHKVKRLAPECQGVEDVYCVKVALKILTEPSLYFRVLSIVVLFFLFLPLSSLSADILYWIQKLVSYGII